MKRILILLIAISGITTTYAEDYTYLTIVEQDGSKTSLTAVGLSMTFSSDKLTVSNAYTDESKTIALSNLASMNFSNTDETTGIRIIQTEGIASINDVDAIYTLQGLKIPTGTQLSKGIYIIRKNNVIQKLQVR